MTEIEVLRVLWSWTTVWVLMMIADGLFHITKVGVPHGYKTVGAFLMLSNLVGWAVYFGWLWFNWVGS